MRTASALWDIVKWSNLEEALSLGPHIRNMLKKKMVVVVISVIFKVPVKHTSFSSKDNFIPGMGDLTRFVRLVTRLLAS